VTILYLEPIPYAQHQFFCAWELCSGALLVGLSMIVNYSSGCADCSEPVVGEYIAAETWVGSGGEGLREEMFCLIPIITQTFTIRLNSSRSFRSSGEA